MGLPVAGSEKPTAADDTTRRAKWGRESGMEGEVLGNISLASDWLGDLHRLILTQVGTNVGLYSASTNAGLRFLILILILQCSSSFDEQDHSVPRNGSHLTLSYINRLLQAVAHLPSTSTATVYRALTAGMMNDMTDPDAKAKLDALFEKAAATYEEANGDTTKAICRALLSLCNEFGHPIDGESVILDNAAGPGILTGQLIKSLSPSKLPKIFATDFSAAMIRVLDAKGWTDKYGVRTAIMDAQDLKFQNDVFTHSFMNLGIFLIPDPEQGAKEIFRTLRSGGIALTTSIKVTGWLPPFQKAQERIRPGQKVFQGMLPEKWSEASYLKSVMEAGGFAPENVDVRTASAPIEMVNFRSEQAGISKMVSAMITSGWSEDEKAGFAAALEEELKREIEMEKTGTQRHMGVWIAVAKK